MTKPIAERFKEKYRKVVYVYQWLYQQPENQKTFTIEEVEQIAKSSWETRDKYHHKAKFEYFWAEKKAELIK